MAAYIDSERLEVVLEEMGVWAHGHPRRDEPFCFIIYRDDGPSALIPLEFLREAEDRRGVGERFLEFLFRQSEEDGGEHPADYVRRAVEANEAPRPAERDRCARAS